MVKYKVIGPERSKSEVFRKRCSWCFLVLVFFAGGVGTYLTHRYHSRNEWHNQYNLVHVVETDFLQYQLELKHLNQARINLFEVFTVPSMEQQTNKEFLWLLWTDPNLGTDFVEQLRELLKDLPNAVVLGRRRDRKIDFRELNGMKEEEIGESVVIGNERFLRAYFKASKSRLLLETRLDADDSLHKDFVEAVQQQASQTIAISDLKTDYRIFCPEHHTEWRYYKPDDDNVKTGHLVHYQNPIFCINTGLTVGYQKNAKSRHLNTLEQCNVHQWYEECVAQGYTGAGANHAEGTPYIHHYCVGRVRMLHEQQDQAVLLSRTPTTAGMKRVLGSEKTYKKTFESRMAQQQAWDMIRSDFGVKKENVMKVRADMELDMPNILQDALEGQCMPGHSCKSKTKRKLLKLMEKVKNEKFPTDDLAKIAPAKTEIEKAQAALAQVAETVKTQMKPRNETATTKSTSAVIKEILEKFAHAAKAATTHKGFGKGESKTEDVETAAETGESGNDSETHPVGSAAEMPHRRVKEAGQYDEETLRAKPTGQISHRRVKEVGQQEKGPQTKTATEIVKSVFGKFVRAAKAAAAHHGFEIEDTVAEKMTEMKGRSGEGTKPSSSGPHRRVKEAGQYE